MDPVARWVRDLPPQTADLLLAVGLAALFSVIVLVTPAPHGNWRHFDGVAVALTALASLALVGRRRAPLLTLAISAGLMAVYEARNYAGGPALLAPLVALYTVSTLWSRKASFAAAVLVGVALSAARVGFTAHPARTAVADSVGYLGAALFLGWAVANRRAFVAEIRDRADRAERTREEEARRRVDAERLRIARELHDAVAHSVTTIAVQAGVSARVLEKRPQQVAEALESIATTSRQALDELRQIVTVLRDGEEADLNPAPGLDELERLLETSRQGGLQVELVEEGELRALPVAVDQAAYRILQESLTNVIRHGSGAHARLGITYEPTALRLAVTNDRSGTSIFRQGSGHGIDGMRERARALGGTLEAGPTSDGGFQVTAVLPLQRPPGR